jgi:hypothetical protein
MASMRLSLAARPHLDGKVEAGGAAVEGHHVHVEQGEAVKIRRGVEDARIERALV